MRREIKTIHVTCDLCGQETKEPFIGVSEATPVGAISIRHEIWYGGTFELKDFCKPCSAKIVDFLQANNAVGKGQKVT